MFTKLSGRRLLGVGTIAYCVLVALILTVRLFDLPASSLLSLFFNLAPLILSGLPLAIIGALFSRSHLARILTLALSFAVVVWGAGIVMPFTTGGEGTADSWRMLVFNSSGKNVVREAAEAWFSTRPADIILMQESVYADGRYGVERLRQTYPYQAFQIGADGLHYRGLTTFSSFPMLEEGREGFFRDSYFTRVVIVIDDVETAVYNVSLPAPFADTPDASFSVTPLGLIRTFNTEQRDAALDALLNRLAQETLPMIVGGEFNLTEFEPAYTRLARVLTDSYREAGAGLGFTFPAGGGYSLNGRLTPFLRLDYVWHSPAFRTTHAWLGEQVSIADRLPVFADLRFSSPG